MCTFNNVILIAENFDVAAKFYDLNARKSTVRGSQNNRRKISIIYNHVLPIVN